MTVSGSRLTRYADEALADAHARCAPYRYGPEAEATFVTEYLAYLAAQWRMAAEDQLARHDEVSRRLDAARQGEPS